MEKEHRKLKVMIGKAGGNSGKNSLKYSMSIPNSWADKLNITKDDREFLVTFDGEKIVIEREK